MRNLLALCLLFVCTSVSAQSILLGENAYVNFLHNDTICIEVFNLYTFLPLKKNKIKVEKIQYAYNKKNKSLVVIKSSDTVEAQDVPGNILDYAFRSKDIVVRAYKKPTHCFLVLRNKVYTHFGLALR